MSGVIGSNRRMRRIFGTLAAAALALFFANILIGKYRVATGQGTAAPLDGVPEFLVLIFAVACFVICMLRADDAPSSQEEKG